MTLIIADPALTAAPAPLAGSAARTRDLRAELADAIQNRRAAEAIAADAKRLSDRGERAKTDANMVVNQLKTRRSRIDQHRRAFLLEISWPSLAPPRSTPSLRSKAIPTRLPRRDRWPNDRSRRSQALHRRRARPSPRNRPSASATTPTRRGGSYLSPH